LVDITKRESFVSTDSWGLGGAAQYKPISYAIENCHHFHKISCFPFAPSISQPKVFTKHTKKKTFWIYIAYCDFSDVVNN